MEKGGLAKIVGGIILSLAAHTTLPGCACTSLSQRADLTEAEVRYTEHYKTRYPIQIPIGIQYTVFDPAPWAHSPIFQPDLIPKKGPKYHR